MKFRVTCFRPTLASRELPTLRNVGRAVTLVPRDAESNRDRYRSCIFICNHHISDSGRTQELGVEALHTGPMKKSGGIRGWDYTPSVDGGFDRITLDIDSVFGNEEQYKQMVQTAKNYGGIIVGDVIPGHTGKGADFRLAERAFKSYPGLYVMVEINPEHWSLLPEVPAGADSANLSYDTVSALIQLGYLPGFLQRVLYSIPGESPRTGWDVTPEILGVDGKERRWVYLHYFKRNFTVLFSLFSRCKPLQQRDCSYSVNFKCMAIS